MTTSKHLIFVALVCAVPSAFAFAQDDAGAPVGDSAAPMPDTGAMPAGPDMGVPGGPPPVPGTPGAVESLDRSRPMTSRQMYPIDTGFFLEVRPGLFFSLAGEKFISDAEPYVSFNIGYDLMFGLSLGLDVAVGGSGGNARLTDAKIIEVANANGYNPGDPAVDLDAQALTNSVVKDFIAVIGDAFIQYRIDVSDRWAIPITLAGGVAKINPVNNNNDDVAAAINDPKSVDPSSTTRGDPNKATAVSALYQEDPLGSKSDKLVPNAGFMTGIHYYTRMRHFHAGFEIGTYYLIGPNIPTLAVYPTVRYTF